MSGLGSLDVHPNGAMNGFKSEPFAFQPKSCDEKTAIANSGTALFNVAKASVARLTVEVALGYCVVGKGSDSFPCLCSKG
jgi:hypothetical protein